MPFSFVEPTSVLNGRGNSKSTGPVLHWTTQTTTNCLINYHNLDHSINSIKNSSTSTGGQIQLWQFLLELLGKYLKKSD